MLITKNMHFTNDKINIIIYGNKGGIYVNNNILDNNTLMNIKNQKIVLYLTKQIILLNHTCNNIIPDEKF